MRLSFGSAGIGWILAALVGVGFATGLLSCGSLSGVTLPSWEGQRDDCRNVAGVIRVRVPSSRYPEAADHIRDVTRRRPGWRVLRVARRGAEERRERALAGYPTRPGKDRDEWPPAMSREGGRRADVRYIEPSDNRGAGSTLGEALEPYCDGTRFRVVTK